MKHVLRNILESSKSSVRKTREILPSRDDEPENRVYKVIFVTVICTIMLMVVSGLLVFMISLEGDTQTLVPDVVGISLVDAMMELQDKDLRPSIQQRYSSDPASKGQILEQTPAAGSLVRAGRSVQLVVSQGAVVDSVTDFIGEELNDVRAYLRTISATYEPLMRIASISYVFSESEPGTVIEQSPEPGTSLTAFTDLNLIVSRGPDIARAPVPNYIGMNYADAMQMIMNHGRVFEFEFADAEPSAANPPGTVVAQNPPPGEEAAERGRIVMKVIPPADDADAETDQDEFVLDMFRRTLPLYPIRVELSLQKIGSDGSLETLVEGPHDGGVFSVPYYSRPGDTLILSRMGTEIIRYVVSRR
ncbi:PASTA domain-containing protein [Spirochaeta dissipatitropha]